jgi:hypothetical protein
MDFDPVEHDILSFTESKRGRHFRQGKQWPCTHCIACSMLVYTSNSASTVGFHCPLVTRTSHTTLTDPNEHTPCRPMQSRIELLRLGRSSLSQLG